MITQEDQLIIVKTKFGELYVGIMDKYNENKLIDAYQIQVVPENQNTFNVMLVPIFMPMNKNSVNLNLENSIMSIIDAPQDLIDQYTLIKNNMEVPINSINSPRPVAD